ncbi:MAG: hypothetical protein KAR06_08305, partial [Deltaproteobacteria bacterium]|nr:hypothetical protein [Deltaproteobacteria bacterium]
MADINVSAMYDAVYEIIDEILNPGAPPTPIKIRAGYQNIAAPEKLDDMGKPEAPYISIVEIPISNSEGYPDISEWTEDSPGSTGGSQQAKDDYEATYEIHQTGGRGELLQKVKVALNLDNIAASMNTKGIASRRTGPTMPTYNSIEKRWGPDCMAEFIFAGSYRLA